jgi:hypothetical protein
VKNFGTILGLGLVILLGLIIYTTDHGPERIVDGIIQGVGAMIVLAGASGLIVSLGFAVGYAGRNLLEHKTPVGTERVERHVIERHTLDGRMPGQPQIMTLPGAFDQYPAQYGQMIAGARVDAQHQLSAPAKTAEQSVQVDVDAVYQPAEW